MGKTRKIKVTTTLGKLSQYSYIALAGAFLGRYVVYPNLNNVDLPLGIASLAIHEYNISKKTARNPKFGGITNSTTDALLLIGGTTAAIASIYKRR
jgi:hypothetical protein|tara:strand:+ start:641 stop:928 length:288 start_codon:yes stop_codon:yes gene_type:complete